MVSAMPQLHCVHHIPGGPGTVQHHLVQRQLQHVEVGALEYICPEKVFQRDYEVMRFFRFHEHPKRVQGIRCIVQYLSADVRLAYVDGQASEQMSWARIELDFQTARLQLFHPAKHMKQVQHSRKTVLTCQKRMVCHEP